MGAFLTLTWLANFGRHMHLQCRPQCRTNNTTPFLDKTASTAVHEPIEGLYAPFPAQLQLLKRIPISGAFAHLSLSQSIQSNNSRCHRGKRLLLLFAEQNPSTISESTSATVAQSDGHMEVSVYSGVIAVRIEHLLVLLVASKRAVNKDIIFCADLA